MQIIEKQCGIQQLGALEKYEFAELLKILNGTEKVSRLKKRYS